MSPTINVLLRQEPLYDDVFPGKNDMTFFIKCRTKAKKHLYVQIAFHERTSA